MLGFFGCCAAVGTLATVMATSDTSEPSLMLLFIRICWALALIDRDKRTHVIQSAKMRCQSFFMSTTLHLLTAAASSATSSFPKCDWRS